jgi:hypothetical protein
MCDIKGLFASLILIQPLSLQTTAAGTIKRSPPAGALQNRIGRAFDAL